MATTNQVRHWMFTWYETEKVPFWNPDKMAYMIYQPELCPTTERLHFQGYVAFKRSMKMGMVKKALMSNTVHVEPINGTPEQARHYCMKKVEGCVCRHCMGQGVRIEDGEITEHGTFTTQGKRSDLEDVSKAIKEGKSIKEIVAEHTTTSIRYLKGIKAVHRILVRPTRPETTTNVIIYGSTEAKKSTYVWSKFERDQVYNGYIKGNWWENYREEPVAFYDEFDGGDHMDVSYFKRITDRFPVVVPCKGDSYEYVTGVNIFASNVDPRNWYPAVHWEPIKRRMNHIIYCRKYGEEMLFTCEKCNEDCDMVNDVRECYNKD